MRYAQIRSMDISNGENIGVSLFVQGCHYHCYNCFNSETWDFSDGDEWSEKIEAQFLKLVDNPFIKRISILGGEPLSDENVDEIYKLLNEIRHLFQDKVIWLYTGSTWEEVFNHTQGDVAGASFNHKRNCRQNVIRLCDVLVDGRYIDELRDLKLKWCGSKNQRVIDVQSSLQNGKVILRTK